MQLSIINYILRYIVVVEYGIHQKKEVLAPERIGLICRLRSKKLPGSLFAINSIVEYSIIYSEKGASLLNPFYAIDGFYCVNDEKR